MFHAVNCGADSVAARAEREEGRSAPHPPTSRMLAAAWIVSAVFVLSNAPTPLYMHWQSRFAFSASTLTALFGVYVVGLLITLPVAGQCSDAFGCRRVLLPGLAAGMLACVLFATAHSVAMLLVARFVSGMAIAAAITAGMAAVMELGGARRRRAAALLASAALVLGASLGPLMAGWFALVLDEPSAAVFWTEFALLASAGVVAALLPFARRDGARAVRAFHFPGVPRRNWRHLALGISLFGCAMGSTAFVLSLGPSVLALLAGLRSPLLAGGMACGMFLAATLAQLPVRRAPVHSIFALGALAVVLGPLCTLVAVLASLPAALIVGALFAGAGHGLSQLAGLTLIGLHVPEARRAEATAILNIGGYIPCGLVPVLSGLLVDRAGLARGTLCFAVFISTAALAARAFVRSSLAGADEPTAASSVSVKAPTRASYFQ